MRWRTEVKAWLVREGGQASFRRLLYVSYAVIRLSKTSVSDRIPQVFYALRLRTKKSEVKKNTHCGGVNYLWIFLEMWWSTLPMQTDIIMSLIWEPGYNWMKNIIHFFHKARINKKEMLMADRKTRGCKTGERRTRARESCSSLRVETCHYPERHSPSFWTPLNALHNFLKAPAWKDHTRHEMQGRGLRELPSSVV